MNVVLEWLNDLRQVLDDQDQLIQAVRVGIFHTAVGLPRLVAEGDSSESL